MTEDDDVDRLSRERRQGAVRRPCARARMSVREPDPNAVDLEDPRRPEPIDELGWVVVAGDRDDGRDRRELIEDADAGQVARMQDQLDRRPAQPLEERSREPTPETGQMGVADDADAAEGRSRIPDRCGLVSRRDSRSTRRLGRRRCGPETGCRAPRRGHPQRPDRAAHPRELRRGPRRGRPRSAPHSR